MHQARANDSSLTRHLSGFRSDHGCAKTQPRYTQKHTLHYTTQPRASHRKAQHSTTKNLATAQNKEGKRKRERETQKTKKTFRYTCACTHTTHTHTRNTPTRRHNTRAHTHTHPFSILWRVLLLPSPSNLSCSAWVGGATFNSVVQ